MASTFLLTFLVLGVGLLRVVFAELSCPRHHLPCNEGETCLAQGKWCDGTADCPNGEDEVPDCDSRLAAFDFDEDLEGQSRKERDQPTDRVICAAHEIPCNDSRTCISQHLWCDGLTNCPNRDDESPDCAPISSTFEDLQEDIQPCMTRVGKLKNVSSRGDEAYADQAFDSPSSNCADIDDENCDSGADYVAYQCEFTDLPDDCYCEHSSTLDLFCETTKRLVNLKAVKPSPNMLTIRSTSGNLGCLGPNKETGRGIYSFMEGLLTLNFSSNGLSCIYPWAFRSHNLAQLDLSSNNLTKLTNRSFASFHVCSLFLQDNRLVDWIPDAFQPSSTILWLDLRGNRLKLEQPGMLQNLVQTVVIDFPRNNITKICKDTFKGLSRLSNLDLSINQIVEIQSGAFVDLIRLKTLILSRNHITTLPEDLFSRNRELRHLELAFNPMRVIPNHLFRNLNCTILDLRGLIIENINKEMFSSLPATCVVMFEKLYYCFSAPDIRNCTPKGDGISSFEDLLVSPLLVSLAWILGIFTIICNLAVFCARWYLDRSLRTGIHDMVVRDARVMSLFVKNLCISDLLTGVYLLGICYHNELYKGQYNRHAISWIHSYQCKSLGIVAMSSAEISMMILTFIAVDRFVSLVFGLHKPKCSVTVVRFILVLLWAAGLTIAVVPAFLWGDRIHDYYGNNGVCLPLYLQEPYRDGWIYSLVVLIGLNGSMILLIIFSYVGIFLSIRKWRKCEPVIADERQERELLGRFFFLVFLNLCCWIPTFVFKILAVTSYKVPDDSYAWIVTFVFPLNSAMNPIVYSLSSSEFRSRVCRVTGCQRAYIVIRRRLHVLQRRLSAPFGSSCDPPPSADVLPPTNVKPDPAAELSVSPSLCSRIREKCRAAVTPRSSVDVRMSARNSRSRGVSDLRLDVPLPHEVIALNGLDAEPEPDE